jgi:hypothetical protein
MGAVFQVDIEHPFEQPGPAQAVRRRGRGASAWSAEGVLGFSGTLGMTSRGESLLHAERIGIDDAAWATTARRCPAAGLGQGSHRPGTRHTNR